MIYGELFAFQLRLAVARRNARGAAKSHRVSSTPEVERIAAEVLPFRLTAAQDRVIGEVLEDLAAAQPMRRLVQGDVGSGKTAVAAVALIAVLEAGLQGAFMAPTELLAEQHHATLAAMLGSRYRVELLTGSTSSADLRSDIERGRVELVIGTKTMIQQQITFRRLGLAVAAEVMSWLANFLLPTYE